MEEALQEKVLALQQQLAARDAEVAALKQRDDEHYGWYIGTIAGTGLGARDLKKTPRANCVVSYRKKETMVASLDGKVACELSKHLYGVDQWWVLLKKKE